jgi:hypothetical protein
MAQNVGIPTHCQLAPHADSVRGHGIFGFEMLECVRSTGCQVSHHDGDLHIPPVRRDLVPLACEEVTAARVTYFLGMN